MAYWGGAIMNTKYKNGIYDGTEKNSYETFVKLEDKSVTNVTIHDDTTNIGYRAFAKAELTSVAIPDSVQEIGIGAFAECKSLTDVTIGSGLTTIRAHAFANCDAIEKVTLDVDAPIYNFKAFKHCDKLTTLELVGEDIALKPDISQTSIRDIVIRDGAKTILEDAFSSEALKHIETIRIPTSVVAIEDGAFSKPDLDGLFISSDVTSKFKVVFEDASHSSLESIGSGAFVGCKGISDISLPDSVKTIGEAAFAGSSVQQIALSDNVTHLGARAFSSATELSNVELGSGITTIHSGTFEHCRSLESITMSNQVETIKQSAFYGCTSLKDVELSSSLKEIGPYAFASCEALEHIKIPLSVEHVSPMAFDECTSLRSITLGDKIINIHDFSEMSNLNEMLQQLRDEKAIETLSATAETVKLSNLVEESQAFVINDELVYVRPETTGKIVIDMDIDKIDPFAFKNSGVTVVEGAAHLKDDIVRAGVSYATLELDKENVNDKAADHKVNYDIEI